MLKITLEESGPNLPALVCSLVERASIAGACYVRWMETDGDDSSGWTIKIQADNVRPIQGLTREDV